MIRLRQGERFGNRLKSSEISRNGDLTAPFGRRTEAESLGDAFADLARRSARTGNP